MSTVVTVDIHSDISCPWCYVGKRNFERALAAFTRNGTVDVRVTLHPYQIDGERPATAVPMLEWLAGKYGAERAAAMSEEVTAAGERIGITFRNASGFAVNTLHGHRLLWLAGREYGREVQALLEELLFTAWFTEGGDVSDTALLLDRAVRAGMDHARVSAFLASGEGTAEVRAAIAASHARVSAVPAFAFGDGTTLVGAQDEATFLGALEQAAAAGEGS
ncbi:DsbA family oxidoreductase [Streptomyces sp. NPDC053048]|uniref:DsbA family oxidoreductase n=1 Tax=Streptomyces sp. NPDC053048 TaxID=3365694 RepID=UPI0037D5CF48